MAKSAQKIQLSASRDIPFNKLVLSQANEGAVLLTGDGLLRRVAGENGLRVHGVLWVIDELKRTAFCRDDLLISALEAWNDDASVFLPLAEIEHRLRSLRRG